MAKRGRKPKERKGYFYEREEQAVQDYINETNIEKKNQIFNTILYPAFTKMIESIIRRYKLFVPDEEFEQNFSDTISYLLTKVDHFKPVMTAYTECKKEEGVNYTEVSAYHIPNPEEGPEYIAVWHTDGYDGLWWTYYKKEVTHRKAYSYCGTICKNYLMYKCTQYARKRQRNTPYDEVFEEISNSQKFSTDEEDYTSVASRLIKKTADEIGEMIDNAEENELTPDEIKVGKALINLMTNWEDILQTDGSNKLRKSSVLYFLREETMMTTKEVRDSMRRYKKAFLALKKLELEGE